MLRSALFVDIGYVVAAGGSLCLGTSVFGAIACDYPALAPDLAGAIAQDSGLPLLRSYWYDAVGVQGLRNELRALRSLPRLKLRLGSLGREGQKEVDILLHDELTELARGGLVASIYLLSGDADFRPTIAKAQARGVEVVLLHIPVGTPTPSLVREVDRLLVLPAEFWQPHFARIAPPRAPAPSDRAGQPDGSAWTLLEQSAAQAGGDFARTWLRTATLPEVERIRRLGTWDIPHDIDLQLIRAAHQLAPELRDRPELNISVRAGFWAVLCNTQPSFPPT